MSSSSILDSIVAFLNAETWAESQLIVELCSELLTDEAIEWLDQLIASQDQEHFRRHYKTHLKLLTKCRASGIVSAFTKLIASTIPEAPVQYWETIQHAEVEEQRYDRLGDLQALDRSIGHWEQIIHHPEFDQTPLEFQLAVLNNIGSPIYKRFSSSNQLSDLEQILTCFRSAANQTHKDSPYRAERLQNLAVALLDGFDMKGSIGDLEEALEISQEVVDITPTDSPDYLDYLGTLGTVLYSNFLANGNPTLLQKAIAYHQQVGEDKSTDDPDRPMYLFNLGLDLIEWHDITGNLIDLERAIRCFQEAVGLLTQDFVSYPVYQSHLANTLRLHSGITGNLTELETAIQLFQGSMEQLYVESPDRAACLNNLGIALGDRYARLGNPEDLKMAVVLNQEAVQMTLPESPKRADRMNNLGSLLLEEYEITGDPKILHEAVSFLRGSIERTPAASPHLPGRLTNLANGLSLLYASNGDQDDLDESIQVLERVAQVADVNKFDYPGILNSLGNCLHDRYLLDGNLADLEEAFKAHRKAVDKTQPEAIDFPRRVNNLGHTLRSRYTYTGNLQDLESAVEAFQKAATSSSTIPAAEKGKYWNNLGNSLTDLYARTGNPAELGEAIRAYEDAVKSSPENSPDRSICLNNLANALRDQYDLTRNFQDLEDAIQYLNLTVESTLPSSPDYAIRLNNLGVALNKRFIHVRRWEDIEDSIRYFREALQITTAGAVNVAMFSSNLGNALLDRGESSNNPQDVIEAIKVYEDAIRLTSTQNSSLPKYYNNLGMALFHLYHQTQDIQFLQNAVEILEKAWNQLDSIYLFSPVNYKLGQQGLYSGLFTLSVEAAVLLSKVFPTKETSEKAGVQALLFAEGSKSRILNGLLARHPLPAPPMVPEMLLDEEQKLVDRLATIDLQELASHDVSYGSVYRSRRDLHEEQEVLFKELQNLWSQIEKLNPDAATYVMLRRGNRPNWTELQSLSSLLGSDTALLSLFVGTDKTMLFVIRSGYKAPRVIEASISASNWQDIVNRLQHDVHESKGSSRRMETWYSPLIPLWSQVLQALKGVTYLVISPHRQSFSIPWAAIPVDGERLGFRFRIVTVPTFSTLMNLVSRPQATSSREAFIAANPTGDLPGAEEEANQVAKIFGVEALLGHHVTQEAVEEELSRVQMAHLAAHASFDTNDPLNSGIQLADKRLTARRVMQIQAGLDLLSLSACQSGLSQSIGGEELSGLSHSFLLSGTRSILASLWPVDDEVTSFFMQNFYHAYKMGKLDKASSLQYAIRTTAEKWPHPYYWAAFTLFGHWY